MLQSSRESLKKSKFSIIEEERYRNPVIYKEKKAFDLHEMLKDESEDEEDQQNYELDKHLTEPINMEKSNKYRTKIRDELT